MGRNYEPALDKVVLGVCELSGTWQCEGLFRSHLILGMPARLSSGGNSVGKGQAFEDCPHLRAGERKKPSRDDPQIIEESQDMI